MKKSTLAEQPSDQAQDPPAGATSALEWIAGVVGLVLTVTMMGFIGWQAVEVTGSGPPIIDVRVERIMTAGSGWVAEIVAVNLSPFTAAAVQIQGELREGETIVATSQVTFDYVPGHSEQHGGLYFDRDPNEGALSLRALGYMTP